MHDGFLVLAGKDARKTGFQDAEGRDLHDPDVFVSKEVLERLRPAPVPMSDVAEAAQTSCCEAGCESASEPASQGTRPAPVAVAVAFEGLAGQADRAKRFEETREGCRALDKPFPHTLLSGPPGTGKTTIAKRLAVALGYRLVRTAGPMLKDPVSLVAQLGGLRAGDVLFVDEIHAVPTAALETLYEAMEEGRVSGALDLPPFTLLGATTEEGLLPAPLLGRFGLHEDLGHYDDAVLATLICTKADAAGFEMQPDAACRLAENARGTPREATRLLERVLESAAGRKKKHVDLELVDQVLGALGYDGEGLKPAERRYLCVLRRSRKPVPLQRIAQELGTGPDTVTRVLEPHLFRRGLVYMTPRGRATPPPLDVFKSRLRLAEGRRLPPLDILQRRQSEG